MAPQVFQVESSISLRALVYSSYFGALTSSTDDIFHRLSLMNLGWSVLNP